MKTIYTIALAFLTFCTNAQTVTTYLNSEDANVDDAMALDSQGNLYGSTFYGGTVYKITPDGTSSPFITGLSYANGLAVDSGDHVFVCDYGNASIKKYDNDGNLLHSYPLGDAYPSGLIKAYKSDNMVYTDVWNNSVNELAADGSITVLYEGGPLNIPVGLAYGPGGDLYIGNYIGREIYRLPRKGGDLEYVATVPAPNNSVPYLAFIAYAQGFLYGTVYGEHKIYKIDPRHVDDVEIYSGSVYGDDDGNISEATYAYPSGIIANESGNTMYISEYSYYGNIRKITNGNGLENKSLPAFDIQTYPNPASDVLNIALKNTTEDVQVDVRLFNILNGQLALHQPNATISGTYTISLVGLRSGLYELVVSNKDFSETETILIKQ